MSKKVSRTMIWLGAALLIGLTGWWKFGGRDAPKPALPSVASPDTVRQQAADTDSTALLRTDVADTTRTAHPSPIALDDVTTAANRRDYPQALSDIDLWIAAYPDSAAGWAVKGRILADYGRFLLSVDRLTGEIMKRYAGGHELATVQPKLKYPPLLHAMTALSHGCRDSALTWANTYLSRSNLGRLDRELGGSLVQAMRPESLLSPRPRGRAASILRVLTHQARSPAESPSGATLDYVSWLNGIYSKEWPDDLAESEFTAQFRDSARTAVFVKDDIVGGYYSGKSSRKSVRIHIYPLQYRIAGTILLRRAEVCLQRACEANCSMQDWQLLGDVRLMLDQPSAASEAYQHGDSLLTRRLAAVSEALASGSAARVRAAVLEGHTNCDLEAALWARVAICREYMLDRERLLQIYAQITNTKALGSTTRRDLGTVAVIAALGCACVPDSWPRPSLYLSPVPRAFRTDASYETDLAGAYLWEASYVYLSLERIRQLAKVFPEIEPLIEYLEIVQFFIGGK